MSRALRDPRWLAGLAVAVVFAVVCVLLAQWQLDRRLLRAERNAAVLDNYDSEPVPLAAVGDANLQEALAPQDEWQPVRLDGTYDETGTVLVRNRPQGGSNGYLVAVPFTTSAEAVSGAPATTVLLVRGWVPSGADAASPASVPAPPPGEVSVLARLRATEAASTRTAPQGQSYRLDVPTLLADSPNTPLTGAYGVVGQENDSSPASLAGVPRPETDPGPHLAYGVQWYMFAVAGLGIWFVLARRHAGEEHQDTAQAAGARDWVYDPGR